MKLDLEGVQALMGDKFDQAKFDELVGEDGTIPHRCVGVLLKPTLHYFNISGRGELSKLIAAVGGVELEIKTYAFDIQNPEAEYRKFADSLGFQSQGLPIVEHGCLKFCQSSAVQNYFAAIGPNYPLVNPMQQAVDDMFSGVFEDCMSAGASVLLDGAPPQKIVDAMDKALGFLDSYIPETGFVNGFGTPTKADLCILIMVQGLIPFGVALQQAGGYDFGTKFPKVKALSDMVAAHPAVAIWLRHPDCMITNAPGGKK